MILCLMGMRASGKTYTSEQLEKRYPHEVVVIDSFTTRPKRSPDETGHIYLDADSIFVGREGLYDESTNKTYLFDNMVAYQELYGHHYFVLEEQFVRGKVNLYAVDPKGAEMLKERLPHWDIISILFNVDYAEQDRRLTERVALETKDSPLKTLDTLMKYRRDKILDRESLFSCVKTDYVINSCRNIDAVISDILSIIENERRRGVLEMTEDFQKAVKQIGLEHYIKAYQQSGNEQIKKYVINRYGDLVDSRVWDRS